MTTTTATPPHRHGARPTDDEPAALTALRSAVLILATMTTAMTAGIFVHWSNTVGPALKDVDDRTFVEAFQALDAAITNPLFLGVFFVGALLLTAAAGLLHLVPRPRRALVWIAAAGVCYLIAVGITLGVHEPLNQELRGLPTPTDDAEYAAARALLDEGRWTAWNTVRAVAATIAFGCLTWALAIHRLPRR